MPPRWLSAPIIVFWLTTTSWLLYQEVWPLFQSDQAPPFTIDLEDEVQTQQVHIRWDAQYNDHPYLHLETWAEYSPSDDAFALKALVRPRVDSGKEGDDKDPFGGLVQIQRLLSVYRIARNGDLRGASFDFAAEANFHGLALPFEGSFTGEVHDGALHSHLRAESSLFAGKNLDMDLEPVALPTHGSVLSPLHPLNRIEGLRPGRTWRLPLVDPMSKAFAAVQQKYLPGLAPDDGDHEIVLTAQVLPQTQTMTWNSRPVECYVIDYQGEDVTAKTWVQVGTGLVLRQESERHGERLVLQRE
jgi:hypothetical protein